ncbi:hypothetical protein E6O75_ATG01107 [Venturia nashicola]|uniref:Uncharacterized protein n=1 Tax=Venturia nashicola TaxID=86259 RepID=A0A4Z1PG06_9PEZI|nr:hypothetical protein E6O75_ATG01107 [Venturia nashicola]
MKDQNKEVNTATNNCAWISADAGNGAEQSIGQSNMIGIGQSTMTGIGQSNTTGIGQSNMTGIAQRDDARPTPFSK